jgi:hypothetical protein
LAAVHPEGSKRATTVIAAMFPGDPVSREFLPCPLAARRPSETFL